MTRRRIVSTTAPARSNVLGRRRAWLATRLGNDADPCPKCDGPNAVTHRTQRKRDEELLHLCLLCLNHFSTKVKIHG